jgi:2,3-bisphosphoglycerate-dependent phosphoglycerate mutase
MAYLILIRHGQSLWNLQNKFTGWVDVPLSEQGINEAFAAGDKLKSVYLDVAFTSKLVRAQQTLMIILAKQKKVGVVKQETKKRISWSKHSSKDSEIVVFEAEELNERFYGALQGLNKKETMNKYGEEKVFLWRRSYDIRPPKGESLKDVFLRSVPYFKKKILPLLKKNKNVVVVAHGNSLRAIIKFVENIPDSEISSLELDTGKPVFYSYNNGFKKIKK